MQEDSHVNGNVLFRSLNPKTQSKDTVQNFQIAIFNGEIFPHDKHWFYPTLNPPTDTY